MSDKIAILENKLIRKTQDVTAFSSMTCQKVKVKPPMIKQFART